MYIPYSCYTYMNQILTVVPLLSAPQFLLIFRKAKSGELKMDGLAKIAAVCDVTKEGVGGAKSFFEAKVKEQTEGARFEKEVREEQERKRKEAEEAKERRQAFKEKASMWH